MEVSHDYYTKIFGHQRGTDLLALITLLLMASSPFLQMVVTRFQAKVSYTSRILTSCLVIMVVLTVFPFSLDSLDTSISYNVSLGYALLCGAAVAVLTNSVYSLAALFPPAYMHTLLLGRSFAPLWVLGLKMLTKYISAHNQSNPHLTTYFATAFFASGSMCAFFAALSYRLVRRTIYSKFFFPSFRLRRLAQDSKTLAKQDSTSIPYNSDTTTLESKYQDTIALKMPKTHHPELYLEEFKHTKNTQIVPVYTPTQNQFNGEYNQNDTTGVTNTIAATDDISTAIAMSPSRASHRGGELSQSAVTSSYTAEPSSAGIVPSNSFHETTSASGGSYRPPVANLNNLLVGKDSTFQKQRPPSYLETDIQDDAEVAPMLSNMYREQQVVVGADDSFGFDPNNSIFNDNQSVLTDNTISSDLTSFTSDTASVIEQKTIEPTRKVSVLIVIKKIFLTLVLMFVISFVGHGAYPVLLSKPATTLHTFDDEWFHLFLLLTMAVSDVISRSLPYELLVNIIFGVKNVGIVSFARLIPIGILVYAAWIHTVSSYLIFVLAAILGFSNGLTQVIVLRNYQHLVTDAEKALAGSIVSVIIVFGALAANIFCLTLQKLL